MMDAITAGLNREFVEVNGLTLHVMTAGPVAGPPLILLHGFPEFWYGWHNQIQPLAAAGFRVIVPDQRGYNRSDKPPRVSDYTVPTLTADVVALIDHYGYSRIDLVGHDWGGMVAWYTALMHPERVSKLAVLNLPHPAVMVKTISGSPRQMLKSWYMLAFQLPWLAESLLGMGGGAGAARMLKASARRSTFSADDIARYRQAWTRPGALKSMIHWYRALMRHRPPMPADIRVKLPVLMIWGAKDIALDIAMAQPSIDLCDNGRLEVIPTATHWVQHDAAEQVNALLLEYLGD
jgi:pimeloyl-ACP methyl ester carboxylesterase